MKYVILDTDLGCDSDDIGAISVLQNLERNNLIKILSMTSVSSFLEPAKAINIINEHYQNTVRIGMNKSNNYGYKDGYANDICSKYTTNVNDFEESTKVLIDTLSTVKEKVILISVGPLINLCNLLKSSLGEILIMEKVDKLYTMAGSFNSSNPEWNILEDIESAKYVVDNFPRPIIMVPFEVGANVFTGKNLLKSDTPMGLGYFIHNRGPRQSWDPITCYLACEQNSSIFQLSGFGKIRIDEFGVTTFEIGAGQDQFVLNDFDGNRVEALLEELMKP
jgi:inosine-uridine nucleoside N-ribohydrolase